MITKSQFLRTVQGECENFAYTSKMTQSLRTSLVGYLEAASTIFDKANVNKNPNGGVEFLDDAELDSAINMLGDYYEKNIQSKLAKPDNENEYTMEQQEAVKEIDTKYAEIQKTVSQEEAEQKANDTVRKVLLNAIKPKVDEIKQNYANKETLALNNTSNGWTIDNYIDKLIDVCKISGDLIGKAKAVFLEKAVEIFKESNTNLTTNKNGEQVLDKNEAKNAAESLTESLNSLRTHHGVEHKDCNGKYDLLFKAMDDGSGKDYSDDYCYEQVGNKKIKWTMETSISSDGFNRTNHVEPDTKNVSFINGRTVIR